MMNFLKETLECLVMNHKTPKDVCWIGCASGEYAIIWETFAKIADIDYDNDHIKQEVPGDMVVVGNDWWLERSEYDGCEVWRYQTLPRVQINAKIFTNVTVCGGTYYK